MKLSKMELEPSSPNSKNTFFLLYALFLVFIVVQKKVNTATLRLLIHRTSCLPGGPLAGVWELGVWEDSHYSQN